VINQPILYNLHYKVRKMRYGFQLPVSVYFKSDWAAKFNPKSTTKEKFLTGDGSEVLVDMMHRTGDYSFSRDRDLGALILAAPYRGERLRMIFFLPEKAEDFAVMETKFGSFDFAGYTPGKKTKVEFAVPRFTLKTTHRLDEPLQNTAGMRSMYQANKADFSKLSDRDLFVSTVIQKAFVEVNEEGTEAAAATGVIMMTRKNRHTYIPSLKFSIKKYS